MILIQIGNEIINIEGLRSVYCGAEAICITFEDRSDLTIHGEQGRRVWRALANQAITRIDPDKAEITT